MGKSGYDFPIFAVIGNFLKIGIVSWVQKHNY